MFIYYDNRFNKNECFVIISLLIGFIAAWRFRKRFPIKETLIYLIYSFFVAIIFDHTISIEPFDFYDVNDNSSYQFIDFLTYLMYGPFGYFCIYIYDKLKIKLSFTPIYVLLWSLFAALMEFLALKFNVFHYKGGYIIFYSFPIYLLTLSGCIALYRIVHLSGKDSYN